MGGPTSSVLLKQFLTNQQLIDLYSLIASTSDDLDVVERRWDTMLCGWNIDLHRLFDYEISPANDPHFYTLDFLLPEEENEPASIAQIIEAIGWSPVQELQINAYCNRVEDHRALGNLTLMIAEMFDGFINFCGAIHPPYEKGRSYLYNDWRREEITNYFLSQPIPGRIYEIEYQVTDDSTFIYHIADVEFMRNWLAHPHFHMIK